MIRFQEGHTLAQHFEFLGKEIKIDGTLDNGYHAELDGELFESVRQDPGVEFVEDDTLGEYGPSEEEIEQATREQAERERKRTNDDAVSRAAGSAAPTESTGYQARYSQVEEPYEDHYIVVFRKGYTLVQHFAFLGG
jgi:hypothetical protein